MSIRISSGSRNHFDLPIKKRQNYSEDIPIGGIGIYEDCTNQNKSSSPGPFTRPQLVEFLWRVKEIRLKCNFGVTHTEKPEPLVFPLPAPKVTSQNCSLDVKIVRQKYGENSGEANEIDLFRRLLSDFSDSIALWRNDDDPHDYAASSMAFSLSQNPLQKDKDNNFWFYAPHSFYPDNMLTFVARDQINFPSCFRPAESNYISFYLGSTSDKELEEVEPVFKNMEDHRRINCKLNLQGSPVNFPILLWADSGKVFDTVKITSATASIEITEWFEYATTKGLPAWDKLTGRPINGGPAA